MRVARSVYLAEQPRPECGSRERDLVSCNPGILPCYVKLRIFRDRSLHGFRERNSMYVFSRRSPTRHRECDQSDRRT